MARNDYRTCLHATWSEPEGSSHSGNIVCRGVAGGVASILNPSFYISSQRRLRPCDFFLCVFVLPSFLRPVRCWITRYEGQLMSALAQISVFIFRICLSSFMASSRFCISHFSGHEKVNEAAWIACRDFRWRAYGFKRRVYRCKLLASSV